jgi:AcrR family transcriptional regulator
MTDYAYSPTLELTRRQIGGERRTEILSATVNVLVRRGFDLTRFSDVSEATGVAVSTLQYYFGSLESLLIEACLYSSERDIALVREKAAEFADVWDRLVYLVDGFLASDTPGTGWEAMIEFWRAASCRPHLKPEMARDQDAWRGVFVDAINAGTEQGLFRPQRSPELIAMLLVSTCDGTVFPMWMGNQSFDLPAVRTAILEDLARVLQYQPVNSEGEIA